MKTVKSLLLGAAAGLVATAGAQAADLPVKAKPVEYVKVCSAYGAGFYYIPGTDICLRVGGYLWGDIEYNDRGYGVQANGTGFNRDNGDSYVTFRVRNVIQFDARTNTEYGTLRSYFSGGWQYTTYNNGISSTTSFNATGINQSYSTTLATNWEWFYDRAFIQFAGLTMGYVGSFFDFDPSLVIDQQSSKSFKFTPAFAYTAQFGSGISATLSFEDTTSRRSLIKGHDGGAYTVGTVLNGQNHYSGEYVPAIVGNLRVDQAWGDAQISGAAFRVSCTNTTSGVVAAQDHNCTGGTTLFKDKWGYAALGGVNFKTPFTGAGDSFQVEGAWAKGGPEWVGASANPYTNIGFLIYRTIQSNGGPGGPTVGLLDAFLSPTGSLDLSTSYSVNAEFRHFWTPALRSSVAYGYFKTKMPASATLFGYPDFHQQQVTANLIWSPVKNLDLGLEGFWINNHQDNCGGGGGAVLCTQAAGPLVGSNGKNSIDYFGGIFRALRSF
jgi:Porin subfamily